MSGTALSADLMIDVPKLKTHQKVGVTLALKGVVGLNCGRNWLPHRTQGTPAEGGDQFAESGMLQRAEHWIIRSMEQASLRFPTAAPSVYRVAKRVGKKVFGTTDATVRGGGWHGNDTIWRMVLDINRALTYGGLDGRLHDAPARKRFCVVDGIVAGDGTGPIYADAKPCGVVVAGANPVAVDVACAELMGFDHAQDPDAGERAPAARAAPFPRNRRGPPHREQPRGAPREPREPGGGVPVRVSGAPRLGGPHRAARRRDHRMNQLRLYQSLPYPLRVAAASLRGWTRSRWRYDRSTPRRVREARERESFSDEQWSRYQAERTRSILERAVTRVPHYRDLWSARGGLGAGEWKALDRWPVLDKDAIRESPASFLVEGVRPSDLEELHTSGSTGKPLTLWRDRETSRAWYGIWEARCRDWFGLDRHDRWAVLGGQLVTRVDETRPPFWVWNQGLHQLYMSSYHLAPRNTRAYLEAMARHRVRYVEGYPSSLHALASEALAQKIAAPKLDLVLANAEPLYAHQRDAIAEAFRCPVRDTYGMTEIAAAASECEKGTLHVWPDAGIVEVLRPDSDLPVAPGEVGRLVCTGLVNEVMPLIRYEVGDLGSMAPPDAACACGRKLPILTRLEGRSDDVIVTRDGRRIGRLDPVFKADLMLRETQIVQESLDELVVRMVVAPGFEERHAAELESRLRDRVGDMRIRLERVDSIPRSANGKFRAVVSRVAREERAGSPV